MNKFSPRKLTALVNVPNILTVLRIVLTIVIIALFPFKLYATCFVVFIIAALTDYVDGWWARKFNQKTQFGRIMDPFADKALVCGTYICMLAVPYMHDLLACPNSPDFNLGALEKLIYDAFDPASRDGRLLSRIQFGLASWMVIVIVLRELFVTMLRAMVESSGGDFSAKWVGKWKTGLQCVDIPVGIFILMRYERVGDAPMIFKLAFLLLLYVVVVLTLYSGWVYIRAAMNMGKSSTEVSDSSQNP